MCGCYHENVKIVVLGIHWKLSSRVRDYIFIVCV